MDVTISVRSNHNPTVNQSRVCQPESLTARLTGVRQTMNKTKEPTDCSRGPQQQNSQHIVQQKPRAGNKDSELPLPRDPELVDELGRELDTTRLRDENLGIREGEVVSGTLEARNAGISWRFLEEKLNFIEPGSSYHGEFIGRVIGPCGYFFGLGLIAWRPAFGTPQEWIRFAKVSHRPFQSLQLPRKIDSKLGIKAGDMIEFVAKVTVYKDYVEFQIPTTRLKLLQYKSPEEVQTHAS